MFFIGGEASAEVEVGFDGGAVFGPETLDQGDRADAVEREVGGLFVLPEAEMLGVEAHEAMQEGDEIVRLVLHELLEVVRGRVAQMP